MIVTPLSGDTRLRKQEGFQAASRPSQHAIRCVFDLSDYAGGRQAARPETRKASRGGVPGWPVFLVCETVCCSSDANSIHDNRYACAVGLRQGPGATFFAFTCSLWQVLPVRNKITRVRPLAF